MLYCEQCGGGGAAVAVCYYFMVRKLNETKSTPKNVHAIPEKNEWNG